MLTAMSSNSSSSADLVREARFQAERLRRTEMGAFDDAKWVKEGLGAFARAFGRWRSTYRWLGRVRAAVDAIHKGSPMWVQRAAIQDAFRTTVDALEATC